MDGEDSEFGDFSSAFPSHGEKLTTNGQENIAPDSEFRASTENENCNLELNLDFSFNPVTPFATEDTCGVLDSSQEQKEVQSTTFSGFQSELGVPLATDQQRDEDWGDFGGYETAAQDMPLAPIQAAKDDTPMNVNQKKPDGHSSPNNDEVFSICFGCPTGINVVDISHINFRWLLLLQKSIDFTVPLCKWDTSYLQACHYSSIKVDPILATKTDTGFVMEVAQFAVVEGQSAALDLMESFGFEGGVEPTSPTDPSTNSLPFDVTVSHSEPTLLDLTLPNSPSEDMQEDSFTLDADLQGLELQSLQAERQKTSIEQLALNERLVINRTTWIDSELEQLGDLPTAPSIKSQCCDQNKGLTKKASFQEQLQQLGLDTSKTSFTSTAIPTIPEMSISARLVLDRLPNLSFMLQDNVVDINHHYYH